MTPASAHSASPSATCSGVPTTRRSEDVAEQVAEAPVLVRRRLEQAVEDPLDVGGVEVLDRRVEVDLGEVDPEVARHVRGVALVGGELFDRPLLLARLRLGAADDHAQPLEEEDVAGLAAVAGGPAPGCPRSGRGRRAGCGRRGRSPRRAWRRTRGRGRRHPPGRGPGCAAARARPGAARGRRGRSGRRGRCRGSSPGRRRCRARGRGSPRRPPSSPRTACRGLRGTRRRARNGGRARAARRSRGCARRPRGRR